MGWLFPKNYSKQSLYPRTIGAGFRRPYMRVNLARALSTSSMEIEKAQCIVHDTFHLAL